MLRCLCFLLRLVSRASAVGGLAPVDGCLLFAFALLAIGGLGGRSGVSVGSLDAFPFGDGGVVSLNRCQLGGRCRQWQRLGLGHLGNPWSGCTGTAIVDGRTGAGTGGAIFFGR